MRAHTTSHHHTTSSHLASSHLAATSSYPTPPHPASPRPAPPHPASPRLAANSSCPAPPRPAPPPGGGGRARRRPASRLLRARHVLRVHGRAGSQGCAGAGRSRTRAGGRVHDAGLHGALPDQPRARGPGQARRVDAHPRRGRRHLPVGGADGEAQGVQGGRRSLNSWRVWGAFLGPFPPSPPPAGDRHLPQGQGGRRRRHCLRRAHRHRHNRWCAVREPPLARADDTSATRLRHVHGTSARHAVRGLLLGRHRRQGDGGDQRRGRQGGHRRHRRLDGASPSPSLPRRPTATPPPRRRPAAPPPPRRPAAAPPPPQVDISLDSLARRGIFVTFGNASGAVPAFPPIRLIKKSLPLRAGAHRRAAPARPLSDPAL